MSTETITLYINGYQCWEGWGGYFENVGYRLQVALFKM